MRAQRNVEKFRAFRVFQENGKVEGRVVSATLEVGQPAVGGAP